MGLPPGTPGLQGLRVEGSPSRREDSKEPGRRGRRGGRGCCLLGLGLLLLASSTQCRGSEGGWSRGEEGRVGWQQGEGEGPMGIREPSFELNAEGAEAMREREMRNGMERGGGVQGRGGEGEGGSVGEHSPSSAPSMFEIAMHRTVAAVKAGLLPPHLLSAAGATPRPLLDNADVEADMEGGGRRLADSGWHLLGASVSYNSGPSLAAINCTQFRYDSVTALWSVDWRSTGFMTPIQRQYNCQSCWAIAAVDAVATMTAIAANSPNPVPLSTQQICDCAQIDSCCQGGWPEDAFSYILSNGNITSDTNYTYLAQDGQQCQWDPSDPAAAQITGWERVPAYSQSALVKAVNMQPVLVLIHASSTDFQLYQSPGRVVVYDGDCSLEVNHAVLVVGYNLAAAKPYWIIKNSWPTVWGDRGYMYIAMKKGAGKCGMLTVSPMYPVNYPQGPQQVTVVPGTAYPVGSPSDWFGRWWLWWLASIGASPCSGVINPCGSGWCYNQNGIARCYCPSGYTEIVGVPTSKCVTASPCSSATFNPCSAGSCTDVGDGSYVCLCPTGYVMGSRADGAPTCVVANSSAFVTYTSQYGDTCARIQTLFNMAPDLFASLNPFINCSVPLIPGIVVAVNSPIFAGCSNAYAVRPGDTCNSLAWAMTTVAFYQALYHLPSLTLMQALSSFYSQYYAARPANLATLLALNPGLNCTNLFTSQVICVNGTSTNGGNSNPPPILGCGKAYTTLPGDSCQSIIQSQSPPQFNRPYLLSLNPGLSCTGNDLPVGVQICIAPASAAPAVECSQFITVRQGDSCASLWNAANITQSQFFALNPGLQCQAPYLQMGQQLCINSSLLLTLPDPSFFTYTAQPNDTLSYIQSLFSTRCQAWSIALPRIASYNNLTGLSPDSLALYAPPTGSPLVIPCVKRIGTVDCGCAPSNPVCGSDGVTYASYCDANCNFALPVTAGVCSACQTACAGFVGTNVMCNGILITCPYPPWPPSPAVVLGAYQRVNSSSPVCDYMRTQCENVCYLYKQAHPGTSYSMTANYLACYNSCFSCTRVPCGGPAPKVFIGSGTCPITPQCILSNPCSRGWCTANCAYWTTLLTPSP